MKPHYVPPTGFGNIPHEYVTTTNKPQEDKMPSINDWAAKAAERIAFEFVVATSAKRSAERIAAIIATFAEPLVALLREARREHHHDPVSNYEHDRGCCPQCTCESWNPVAKSQDEGELDAEHEPNSNEICDCGADAWNARVDATLAAKP